MLPDTYDRTRREGMRQYGFGPDAMKRIKVCERCGAASPAAARACSECRAALPKSTLFELYKARHLYCASCDTVVPDGSLYCPACGKRIM